VLVILNDEAFNMDRYDSIRPMDKDELHKERISFFRDGVEHEHSEFDSKSERDAEWERIKISINDWYS